MKKFRGIVIKRRVKYIQPDGSEVYNPVNLRIKISNAIIPGHRMLEGNRTE